MGYPKDLYVLMTEELKCDDVLEYEEIDREIENEEAQAIKEEGF